MKRAIIRQNIALTEGEQEDRSVSSLVEQTGDYEGEMVGSISVGRNLFRKSRKIYYRKNSNRI